jgi:anti-sigma factor RsiW
MSSELPSTARERERERARVRRAKSRRPWLSWLARILAAAILFFAGLAIGRAIGSDSASGETNTSVRTLVPTTLTPQQTVTVTVSNP